MNWATFWAIFVTNSSGHPGTSQALQIPEHTFLGTGLRKPNLTP
jgi:hypothetical protein